jgi:hypothetical protein
MHLLWHLDVGFSMRVFYMVFSQCGFLQGVFPMWVFLQAVFFSVGFSAGRVFFVIWVFLQDFLFAMWVFLHGVFVLQCGFFYRVMFTM